MNERAARKRSRPGKEPTQSRAEETVASIIEAAAHVLEAEGFDGFNTNAVGARAGSASARSISTFVARTRWSI